MKCENQTTYEPGMIISIAELTAESKSVTIFGTIDSVAAQKESEDTATEITLSISDRTGSVLIKLRIGKRSLARCSSPFQVGDLIRITGDTFLEDVTGELLFCAREMSIFPLEDAKTLWEIVWEQAKKCWGEPLPAPVTERLEKEQSWIEKAGSTELFFLLYRMTALARKEGYPVTVLYAGSSLVAFLAEITEIDPLPPHYVCPICRHSEWKKDGSVYTGFDLAKKACPKCGTPMRRDGYRIPAEAFFGWDGTKKRRFTIKAAEEIQPKLYELLDNAENVPKTDVRIFNESKALSALQKLERTTGVSARDITPDDETILHLFIAQSTSKEAQEKNGSERKSLLPPLFGSDFMRDLFMQTQPQRISELIRLCGLAYGKNAWKDNADALLKTRTCSLSDVITVREDILCTLCDRGVEIRTAVDIMSAVSLGRRLTETQASVIKSAGLPDWYIDSCQKIQYLSLKSQVIKHFLTGLRLAWYKIHYPTEYDAAYSGEQKRHT